MAWTSPTRPDWLVMEPGGPSCVGRTALRSTLYDAWPFTQVSGIKHSERFTPWAPQSLISPLTDGLAFLLCSFLSYLCVLEISSLLDTQVTDIFTHSAGCLFPWWTASGTAWKLFNFTRPHLSIVGIIPWAATARFRMCFPCWYFERTSLLFPPNLPEIWIIPECLWSIWSCFWCWVRERDLLSFSYRWDPSLLSAVCWRTYLSPRCVFDIFGRTNQVAVAVWVYIYWFHFTDLFVCFCARTILFLLLWLCSIIWNHV